MPNRGGTRIFEKGVHLSSTRKKGGTRRGFNFEPNVKKPISWLKKGGPPMPKLMYPKSVMCLCLSDGQAEKSSSTTSRDPLLASSLISGFLWHLSEITLHIVRFTGMLFCYELLPCVNKK